MTARRVIRPIGPDSTHRVDLLVDGALVIPALDVVELRDLITRLTVTLGVHPQADFVVGPDGRAWCPECAYDGARPDECEGLGCPGDNAAARARRAADAAEAVSSS